MKFFHPRRIWRSCVGLLRKRLFISKCYIHHIDCHIGENTQLLGCRVMAKGKGSIFIGDNCVIRNCTFNFYGSPGMIIVGKDVTINARPDARTGLYVKNGTTITIGGKSLISNSVEITTTDWHWIVDDAGCQLNEDKDVSIGEHVWICRRVLIGKGTSIGSGSVVGAGSIVTRSFPEQRLLIAGNPAISKKQSIDWKK